MQGQITPKLCECGCGQAVSLATQTKTKLGHVKGQPVRFIAGHATRRTPHDYEVRDCGYETACWVWLRTARASGHGNRTIRTPTGPRTLSAYRYEWEKVHGLVPQGLQLHHLCENPRCVNPEHLALVTHTEHRRIHNTPLDAEAVLKIRRRLLAGDVMKTIAADFGVKPWVIVDIKRGRTWTDTQLPE